MKTYLLSAIMLIVFAFQFSTGSVQAQNESFKVNYPWLNFYTDPGLKYSVETVSRKSSFNDRVLYFTGSIFIDGITSEQILQERVLKIRNYVNTIVIPLPEKSPILYWLAHADSYIASWKEYQAYLDSAKQLNNTVQKQKYYDKKIGLMGMDWGFGMTQSVYGKVQVVRNGYTDTNVVLGSDYIRDNLAFILTGGVDETNTFTIKCTIDLKKMDKSLANAIQAVFPVTPYIANPSDSVFVVNEKQYYDENNKSGGLLRGEMQNLTHNPRYYTELQKALGADFRKDVQIYFPARKQMVCIEMENSPNALYEDWLKNMNAYVKKYGDTRNTGYPPIGPYFTSQIVLGRTKTVEIGADEQWKDGYETVKLIREEKITAEDLLRMEFYPPRVIITYNFTTDEKLFTDLK